MKCRACGTEIAERAIVCFRCGAPTEGPLETPRRTAAPKPRRPWAVFPAVLVMIALGVWLVPKTPPDSWERYTAWGALVVATFLVVFAVRRFFATTDNDGLGIRSGER